LTPTTPLDTPPATARSTIGHADLRAICNGCQHVAVADLAGLIAAGRGDVPVPKLRWRCTACGSRDVTAVISSMPQGWRS